MNISTHKKETFQHLLIGVGNTYRCDDGAGRLIAQRIAAMGLPGARVVEATGEGLGLMDAWRDASCVYLFDAVASGGQAGTIYRIEAHAEPVPTGFFHYSTHAFSVAEAIELSRSLGELPDRLILYGIEGVRFEHGTELSPSVSEAVRDVISHVLNELGYPVSAGDHSGGQHA